MKPGDLVAILSLSGKANLTTIRDISSDGKTVLTHGFGEIGINYVYPFPEINVHRSALMKLGVGMMPWNTPTFEGWSIVGMNHYYLNTPNMRRRHLFVALAHPSGMFVKAEGPDEDRLFIQLAQQIEQETFLRKEFYDWKRQIDFGPNGDATTPGFFKQKGEGS